LFAIIARLLQQALEFRLYRPASGLFAILALYNFRNSLMHPTLNIALPAARDAAEAIAHSSDRLDRVKIINNSREAFLTSMDQNADKTILYHLTKAFPKHTINSRVSGITRGEDPDTIWLVDPLIGNWNFSKGYTQFAVSLACQINSVITHAVVICPLVREEYTATRGTGSQLNSRRLRVGKHTDLNQALIGINPGTNGLEESLALQQGLAATEATPRISGCTPLDMLQTSADRLQAGWSMAEDPRSLAAASLILQEAGGLIGTEDGNPDLRSGEEIFYGNPKAFRALLKLRNAS
jgi:myo-inositol-1(or 4)-monophosphatase